MSDLSFENAIYSWIIFWIVYWISGIFITWKGHASGVRKADRLSDVINSLILNMIWTFIGSVVLFYLPIRTTLEINIVIKFILCNLITEIWFYHVHLMVHHPQLYKLFHKQHHEFSKPYALTAMYCSGYEAVICNLFSVGIGPIMLGFDVPYLYFWFGLVALNSTITHSGYKLGWLIDGSHDIHHKNFNCNYGTITLFDRIYGTYKNPCPKIVPNDKKDDIDMNVVDTIDEDELKNSIDTDNEFIC